MISNFSPYLLSSFVVGIFVFLPLQSFAQISQNSSNSPQEQVFLDFRSGVEDDPEPPNLSAKIKGIVIFQAVKPTDKPCYGKLKPEVIDYVSGSFTAPQVKQVAYLVNLGDSCQPRERGTVRLAIFSNNSLATYGNTTGYFDITKISDINGDGINELTLKGSWLGQGYLSIYAKVIEMKKKGILTLKDFGEVFGSNPGNFSTIAYQTATVITASKAIEGKLVFSRANYVSRCFEESDELINPKCKNYQYISSGEPPSSDVIEKFFKKSRSN